MRLHRVTHWATRKRHAGHARCFDVEERPMHQISRSRQSRAVVVAPIIALAVLRAPIVRVDDASWIGAGDHANL